MKSGLRPRDPTLIDAIFARRMARAEAHKTGVAQMRELKSIAEDFRDVKDVTRLSQRAAALERRQEVKDALSAERGEEAREVQPTADVFQLLAQVKGTGGFARLKERVTRLLEQSKAAGDSSNRRIARRALASLSASARGVRHPELQELLGQVAVYSPR